MKLAAHPQDQLSTYKTSAEQGSGWGLASRNKRQNKLAEMLFLFKTLFARFAELTGTTTSPATSGWLTPHGFSPTSGA